MGNQRKKSRRTLLKNFEKEKNRLLTLELELSRALED